MYGIAAWIVKPLASVACSAPVVTVTVCEAVAAAGPIAIKAVAVVELFTVTGPRCPSAAPPTTYAWPKLATVVPCTKCVLAPVMLIGSDNPTFDVFGDSVCSEAAKLMFRANVWLAVTLLLSVAWMLKLDVAAAAGGPLISPVVAFKESPPGTVDPALNAQV